MEVSHPLSERYGKHWTQEEVTAAFAPSDDTVDAVSAWLNSSGGITRERIAQSDNKAWLAFDATVEEAEKLLMTKYFVQQDEEQMMVGCDEYYLPKHLQEHIDYVTPGVKGIHLKRASSDKKSLNRRAASLHARRQTFMPDMTLQQNSSSLDTCDQMITHDCIRALYNIPFPDPNAEVSPNNTMGIFLLSSAYAQEDLDMFFSNFTPYIANGTAPTLNSINGGIAPVDILHAGSEASLDLELAIPLVYPQKTEIYQVDDEYWSSEQWLEGGLFNTFLDAIDGSYCNYEAYGEKGDNPDYDPVYPNERDGGYKGERMCGVYKPTNIISISYMKKEADLPANYQKRQCDEWLKLGLQGVSVFVSSGDSGVGDLPNPSSPNGCLRNGTVFTPAHPNTCPWITSVGATKVYPGNTVYDPESAANDLAGDPYYFPYSSGGGFSNVFSIPEYQASHVAGYFEVEEPPYAYYYDGNYQNSTGLYNRNGRGIPDVSANGDNTAAVYNGDLRLTGGTSASAPIFAAIINLINEERIKAGKGPVGFINPVLYANPGVLNDITNGTNPGCGTEGFAASKGWDPVTGLGTPDYGRMLELFMGLP
ncbi:subtilisin-like protein [Bimuria novae-zelandiae CBS 107.79]|uniref:Subtilisin-like protein n=1 Tax=Bimuria novae-zelandiae CBS 107.79 TaxID=1447943 RepID=A0A6A5W2V7_9PLEO|nr:subtilisin-like protein [Bimuria novae-zelandiae CBS 107.79]